MSTVCHTRTGTVSQWNGAHPHWTISLSAEEQVSMTEPVLRTTLVCGLDAIEPLWKKEYFDIIKVYNLVK